jgi:branched-chain amino acid transport system substrate-binding protein
VLELFTVQVRRFLLIISIVGLVSAGLSACSQNTSPSSSSQKPITIGTSLSYSGDFKSDGLAMKQGYQLWADTINKNGGLLGRPVKLIILDDKSDPDQVAKNYETLISTDHVDLVFGPFSTLLTKPASVVANQHGYAMIEGSGGGLSVFTRGLHNLFDVSLPVNNNLATFALYILSLPQSLRPKTAAYITEDDPFTQPQVDLAKSMLDSGGVKSLYYHVYPAATTTNYTPFADAAIKTNADVVILGTLLPDAAAFINRFNQQHYNPKALIATAGPDGGSDFVKAVGGIPSTEGVFVPNGWYPQANNFQNAEMVNDYLAQYGGTEDSINADVAEAYSVGQVTQQAITKIHSLDNTALINELHSGDTFNTVQGTAQFDSTGQNTLALSYLFQWQQGQFLPVYPFSAAAENPEFPKG